MTVLARPRRTLGGTFRSVPRLVAPAPRDEKLIVRAERMGFARTFRERSPLMSAGMEIPQIEAQFVTAEDGADWCLAALQDVHGIGDAWLWITDLDFSDWPDPLPRPEVWPPATS